MKEDKKLKKIQAVLTKDEAVEKNLSLMTVEYMQLINGY